MTRRSEHFWDTLHNTPQRSRLRIDTRVLCEENSLAYLPALGAEFGARGLLVVDADFSRHIPGLSQRDGLKELWKRRWEKPPGEPTSALRAALDTQLKKGDPDYLVALGGGSTVDLCKLAHRPVIAVPTTVGTGAEVSRFAVWSDPALSERYGERSWALCPRIALLDPTLLVSLPARQLLLGVLDGAVHFYEALTCRGERSLFTDQLCLEGLALLQKHRETVLADKRPLACHGDLLWFSVYSGIVVSNVRLGLIHRCGESLARYTRIGHGQSLLVFLRQALKEDRDAVAASWSRVKETGAFRSVPFSDFSDFFESFLDAAGAMGLTRLSREAAGRITPRLITQMTDEILSDRVLLKEAPRALRRGLLESFIRKCLRETGCRLNEGAASHETH